MTCIVAYKEKNKVWMGGDRLGSSYAGCIVSGDPKIIKKKDMLIGVSGSFRLLQILHYLFEPPSHFPDWGNNYYMTGPFVDALRRLSKEKGYLEVHNGVESTDGSGALIAYRGEIWQLESDLQIRRDNAPYAACGSADMIALGVMHALHALRKNISDSSFLSSKNILLRALEAAEYHNPYVRKPFDFLELNCQPPPTSTGGLKK